VPTPNLSGELAGDDYRDVVLARLDALGYSNFADGIEAQLWLTPANWAHSGATLGTPFGLAHTFRQTGPFRPAARPSGLDNVVFAGANTHPGIGVPMVLLSGRLAADRLLGCATS
jgi:phytoene desaturase